jgi:iron(III) transport system substrate-binding protein
MEWLDHVLQAPQEVQRDDFKGEEAMKRLSWLTCIAVAAAVCAGGTSYAQSPPDDVVQAAAKEGKLVWYTQPGYRTALAKPIAEFNKLYPDVKLEIVEAGGPELMERVRAERRAGRPVGDLITLGDSAAYELAGENGFKPFTQEALPNLTQISGRFTKFIDSEKRYLPICVFAYGINVNTDQLPEKDWPRRWSDLTSGKYAGKLALHDPGRPGGGLALLLVGRKALGDDFFKSLVAQQPRIFARVTEVDGAVVRGERPIAVPGRNRVAKDFGDAPIKWIMPEDGVFVVSYTAGIVKDAPHPAAADLMLNFLLGKSMQQAFADLGDVPVMPGLPGALQLDKVKFLGNGGAGPEDFARMNESMAFGRDLQKAP